MSYTGQKLQRFQVIWKDQFICLSPNTTGGAHSGHRTMNAARKCCERALRNEGSRGLQIRDRWQQKDYDFESGSEVKKG